MLSRADGKLVVHYLLRACELTLKQDPQRRRRQPPTPPTPPPAQRLCRRKSPSPTRGRALGFRASRGAAHTANPVQRQEQQQPPRRQQGSLFAVSVTTVSSRTSPHSKPSSKWSPTVSPSRSPPPPAPFSLSGPQEQHDPMWTDIEETEFNDDQDVRFLTTHFPLLFLFSQYSRSTVGRPR